MNLESLLRVNGIFIFRVGKERMESGIFGEGSQIPTNEKGENSAFSLLIG